MRKSTPGIKIPFFKADQYPEVSGTRCIEIRIPDDPAFLPQIAGLVAIATKAFNYAGADFNHIRELSLMWKIAYDETDWGQCMNCEELLECLEPLFDELNTKIDSLQSQQNAIETVVEAIQGTQVENAAAAPAPQTSGVPDEICGGATALVNEMDRVNRQEYQNAEASGVDNVFEFVNLIVDNIPLFGELPFTALYDLANAFFENEALTYETDFDLIKNDIICDLTCFIEANDGEMNIDIWNDWLVYIGTTYSPNKAAILFNRYAPVHQTFANQIAALINADASLQSYFDTLMLQYFAGTENPLTCTGCTCPTPYCDDMASGLGAMSHEADATYNLALWNACVANSTGEIGGTWVEASGEGGNGAIEGVLVCASDPTFGQQIRQATVIIDLGAEFDVSAVSMRYANVAVAGSNQTSVQLFDGAKALLDTFSTTQSIDTAWRTFAPTVAQAGVRYIAFDNIQSGTGGTPKIGEICVTYDAI